MKRYRVLVVDDSAFMRKIISDLITENTEFEVVGTAKNGAEAVGLVKQLKPDVLTLDIEMPIMNGLDALKVIMKESPTPVVMLSTLTEEGARETIRALELGAIDFVRKPSGSISLDLYKIQDLLLDKLRIAVRARVKSSTSADSDQASLHSSASLYRRQEKPEPPIRKDAHIHKVVVIGTSTGGPRALQTVLSGIPAQFPAPILVVQHMPPNFTKSLADRLNAICELDVVEAQQHMTVCPGTVYIAPGGYHMQLMRVHAASYRIQLTKDEPVSGHRPSVDVLFESLVPFQELERYAVIMTGMGSDGAKGMLELKRAGAKCTIAEAEETSVVYGMPRAAIELHAVDHIMKLQDIPAQLNKII